MRYPYQNKHPKTPSFCIDVEKVDENERAVIELITVEKWQRIIEVAASDPKSKDSVEVS